MTKIKLSFLIFCSALLMAPNAYALTMPTSGNQLAEMSGISAQAYVVQDAATGQVLISKNADLKWTPASLTKLVTALVVLDTKPKLSKVVTMSKADQTAGACGNGGSCIRSAPGVKFTVDGLFHAALMPSANNAANALARSTGLTSDQFAERMNKKAQDLGAKNSHFNEPTGMDETNFITAADYVNIVKAAFSNPYLQKIGGLSSYALVSVSNKKYSQIVKNTDKLVNGSDLQLLGAKTGYLGNVSGYNFASLFNYQNQELAVVVLGEDHLYSAFDETRQLAGMADFAKQIALQNAGAVLGENTSK